MHLMLKHYFRRVGLPNVRAMQAMRAMRVMGAKVRAMRVMQKGKIKTKKKI